MKRSPFFLIAAASLATVAAGQSFAPTAKAQPMVGLSEYQVRVDWQKNERSLSGLVIRGQVTNIGRLPLTYTQVTPTLLDGSGKEVFCGSGYLTVSPLLPGHSAEFRACEAAVPDYAKVKMVFHEAGHLVPVLTTRVTVEKNASGHSTKIAQRLLKNTL